MKGQTKSFSIHNLDSNHPTDATPMNHPKANRTARSPINLSKIFTPQKISSTYDNSKLPQMQNLVNALSGLENDTKLNNESNTSSRDNIFCKNNSNHTSKIKKILNKGKISNLSTNYNPDQINSYIPTKTEFYKNSQTHKLENENHYVKTGECQLEIANEPDKNLSPLGKYLNTEKDYDESNCSILGSPMIELRQDQQNISTYPALGSVFQNKAYMAEYENDTINPTIALLNKGFSNKLEDYIKHAMKEAPVKKNTFFGKYTKVELENLVSIGKDSLEHQLDTIKNIESFITDSQNIINNFCDELKESKPLTTKTAILKKLKESNNNLQWSEIGKIGGISPSKVKSGRLEYEPLNLDRSEASKTPKELPELKGDCLKFSQKPYTNLVQQIPLFNSTKAGINSVNQKDVDLFRSRHNTLSKVNIVVNKDFINMGSPIAQNNNLIMNRRTASMDKLKNFSPEHSTFPNLPKVTFQQSNILLDNSQSPVSPKKSPVSQKKSPVSPKKTTIGNIPQFSHKKNSKSVSIQPMCHLESLDINELKQPQQNQTDTLTDQERRNFLGKILSSKEVPEIQFPNTISKQDSIDIDNKLITETDSPQIKNNTQPVDPNLKTQSNLTKSPKHKVFSKSIAQFIANSVSGRTDLQPKSHSDKSIQGTLQPENFPSNKKRMYRFSKQIPTNDNDKLVNFEEILIGSKEKTTFNKSAAIDRMVDVNQARSKLMKTKVVKYVDVKLENHLIEKFLEMSESDKDVWFDYKDSMLESIGWESNSEDNLTNLYFELGNKIIGNGKDSTGVYSITGTLVKEVKKNKKYKDSGIEVKFTKQYEGVNHGHKEYRGQLTHIDTGIDKQVKTEYILKNDGTFTGPKFNYSIKTNEVVSLNYLGMCARLSLITDDKNYFFGIGKSDYVSEYLFVKGNVNPKYGILKFGMYKFGAKEYIPFFGEVTGVGGDSIEYSGSMKDKIYLGKFDLKADKCGILEQHVDKKMIWANY